MPGAVTTEEEESSHVWEAVFTGHLWVTSLQLRLLAMG